MHPEAYRFIGDALARLPKPSRVIEFGSRNINGTPRLLLHGVSYVGVDQRAGDGVDVVTDAAEYRPESPADLLLCCEMLEHAENAPAVLINAVHCTAPGGHLVVTCATTGRAPHSGIDGERVRPGEFYANVTAEDFTEWLEMAGAELVLIEVVPQRGDLYAVARVPS